MSSILWWTDHLQQESPRVPSPFHSTQQCSYYPAVLNICLILSLTEFYIRAGKLCLIGTARNLSFSWGRRHSPSLFKSARPQCTKTRKISLNSSSRFFFLPDYQLLPRVYKIVPCCTCTIHKGYYIVLHSSPILQIILFCSQPPTFYPLNKIFSALVFKSNIFTVDGLPTTFEISSWVLKIANHYLAAMTDD